MRVRVSVVATVLNEEKSIPRLLESLLGQSRPPEEVIVVDGGSRDGTLAVLEQWAAEGRLPLRVHSCPGANISQGRNVAIADAQGPVVAVTDAGVRLDPHWLEELVRPFEQDDGVNVVAGFFLPDPHTTFELAMGATVLPSLDDVDPRTFWPSSRSVAFRKEAWAAVGGYPEWIDYCEDLLFDFALHERFGPFAFAPRALVYFRPRSSTRSFFRQYYRYARGDGKADLWRRRHAIRYLTYLGVVPFLTFMSLYGSPWWGVGFLVGGALYTAAPYRRLSRMMHDLPLHKKLYAIALVPYIRVVGDIAKMIGYPVGWMWRLRHRAEIPR